MYLDTSTQCKDQFVNDLLDFLKLEMADDTPVDTPVDPPVDETPPDDPPVDDTPVDPPPPPPAADGLDPARTVLQDPATHTLCTLDTLTAEVFPTNVMTCVQSTDTFGLRKQRQVFYKSILAGVTYYHTQGLINDNDAFCWSKTIQYYLDVSLGYNNNELTDMTRDQLAFVAACSQVVFDSPRITRISKIFLEHLHFSDNATCIVNDAGDVTHRQVKRENVWPIYTKLYSSLTPAATREEIYNIFTLDELQIVINIFIDCSIFNHDFEAEDFVLISYMIGEVRQCIIDRRFLV